MKTTSNQSAPYDPSTTHNLPKVIEHYNLKPAQKKYRKEKRIQTLHPNSVPG
jgi:hypothetical protein